MVSLKNILTRILHANGFEVFEKEDVVFGQKGDDLVTVGIFDRVTITELKAHARKVADSGARNVVCALDASPALEADARALGLVLWRKSDIESEIGEAIDVHISRLGSNAFGKLVGGEDTAPTAESMVTIDRLGTEGPTTVMKCILSQDDVREISRKTIQGFKFDLELVPHYVFQYSCSYQGPGGKDVSRNGIVSVNALTGRCSTWDRMPEEDPSLADHIQMEPKLDEANARTIAVKAIVSLNTEFRDMIIERDHATIMEKAAFGPGEESIMVLATLFVMVPVWCVEGKHGVMILDGMSGKIISEDYYDKR